MSVLAPDLEYLRAALQSLARQSMADFELIILEDPSASSAEELVAEFEDPRLIYKRNTKVVSLAESRNRCIQMANADLLAIMDADDICHPERLQKQSDFLSRNETVDVLGSQIAIIDSQARGKGYRSYPTEHAALIRAMRRFNPLAHPSIMMRKSAVLAVGGYHEEAAGACDDYDLWSRMAEQGMRFANHPEALLEYRLHPGSMKSRLLHQTLRDSIRIKRKYFGSRLGQRERMRILGEQALLCMPAGMVSRLFATLTIRRSLPQQPNAKRSRA